VVQTRRPSTTRLGIQDTKVVILCSCEGVNNSGPMNMLRAESATPRPEQ